MGTLPRAFFRVRKSIDKITTKKNNAIQTKVVPRVNAIKGAVKNKLSNAASSKGYIVLAPYKAVMIRVLKKRGHLVSSSASIKAVANMFRDSVILGKKNFDYGFYNKMNYERQHVDAETAIAVGSALAPSANSVIESILNFISGLGKKKEQGQSLTEDETMLVNEDEKIESKGADVVKVGGGNWFTRLLNSIFGHKENFRRRIDSRNAPQKTQQRIITTQPIVNATELAYSNVLKSRPQSYMPMGVISANDLVNNTPNMVNNFAAAEHLDRINRGVSVKAQSISVNALTPNTWFRDKSGNWHWVNARGKLASYDEIQNYISNRRLAAVSNVGVSMPVNKAREGQWKQSSNGKWYWENVNKKRVS